MITTDLMARGMDFKGVKLVVNYDFPQVCGFSPVCETVDFDRGL